MWTQNASESTTSHGLFELQWTAAVHSMLMLVLSHLNMKIPMSKLSPFYLFVAAAALSLVNALPSAAAQSNVVVQSRAGQFLLTRDGEPYRIKGVGGDQFLAELAEAGGNSIRTWGAEQLGTALDQAQKHGLTVCAGLWLGHERHGFDYQDAAAVRQQLEKTLADVRKYKDHPALLMWGIGNEMEGDGTDPLIWKAVNEIAREVKRIDPSHPTMTVIAELGDGAIKLKNLERFCPDVDIVGVNSYGGIPTLASRYKASGISKPYIVTEHGPAGPWETGKTAWGAPIELTSTEKGKAFANGYLSAVLEQPDLCLGSYAFLWGHKQETTATWFGMLLPDGSRLAAVDAMSEAWTGSAPNNRCPQIASLRVDRTQNLKPGSTINATVSVSDLETDRLTIKWILRSDAGTIGVGGDAQEAETTLEGAIQANKDKAVVTVPVGKGGYRLFAYVYDGQGGAAVANVPIYVDGKVMAPSSLPQSKLPFAVYQDESPQTVFAPSGYMGNTSAVSMELECTNQPHSGKTCIKASYSYTADWAGVLWQSPANDWDGTQPGGANLTGATQLEFWVRGAKGGEVVNFVFGVLDGDQPYHDTAKGELKDVKLTSEWQKLTIPLTGKDVSRIKTGFGWSLAGQGKPVTFYLDDIRYVAP